jgi:hypothetical protein
LSEDQKLNKEETCQNVLEKIEEDPDFFNSVVTCDETWLFQYDKKTKGQSMQWKTTHSLRPKKARMSKSKIKKMIVVFFDIQGIIMTQCVPPGQTVNQTYYIEFLTKLRGKNRMKENGVVEEWLDSPPGQRSSAQCAIGSTVCGKKTSSRASSCSLLTRSGSM